MRDEGTSKCWNDAEVEIRERRERGTEGKSRGS